MLPLIKRKSSNVRSSFNSKSSLLILPVLLILSSCNSKTYLPETFSQEVVAKFGGEVSISNLKNDSNQSVLDLTLTQINLDSSAVNATGSLLALQAFENLEEGANYDLVQVNIESGSLTRSKMTSFAYSLSDLEKVSKNWAFLEEYFGNELTESIEQLYAFYDPTIFTQQDVGTFILDFKTLDAKETFKSNNLIGFQIGYLTNNQKAIMFLVQKEFEKASAQFVFIFKYDVETPLIAGVSTI